MKTRTIPATSATAAAAGHRCCWFQIHLHRSDNLAQAPQAPQASQKDVPQLFQATDLLEDKDQRVKEVGKEAVLWKKSFHGY